MLQMLKKLFRKPEPPPNPYLGLFKNWNCSQYAAWSPDRVFCLWIANGLSYFDDNKITPGKRALLVGMSKQQKAQIWEALMRDLNAYSMKRLKELNS